MPARRIAVIIAVFVLCAFSALAQSELRLPPDQTVEATGPNGAIVNYSASGSGVGDDENGRPLNTANCSPASGSLFALGTTTVTCSAGNPPATGSFKVHVVDRTAPALSLPRGLRVKATGGGGAVVTYS
ncbi:MAG TPA: hypothetical protein VN181_09865, partial [Thermoanaerobaculia bacterium]|nr:hypothetical protein [Thermoanaerobaculia bacterium]